MGFGVILGEVARVSAHLVNIGRAGRPLLFELQDQNLFPGQNNRVGPPTTLKRQFVLENYAPVPRSGTSR